MRLYRAWSLVDDFNGQDQVLFNWFVVGRKEPVIPYSCLIENYDESEDESIYDHMLVNEYFTWDETEELRSYLWSAHQLRLMVEEVPLPVRSGGLSYGLRLISGVQGFYALADEEGYPLEISVLGHYDPAVETEPGSLSGKDIQISTDFLNRVFDRLGLPAVEEHELQDLLEKIYLETGYWVVKKST